MAGKSAVQIPMVEAARRLGLGYNGVRDRVTRGLLKGGRDAFGHWFVDGVSLARAVRQRQRQQSRKAVAR